MSALRNMKKIILPKFKIILKSKLEYWILRKFGIGFCMRCGHLTRNVERFCDDVDYDEEGNSVCGSSYPDFCCESCYEVIKEACL